MVDNSTAALHDAGLLGSLPSMGGVSFGSGAFPNATQAAFGGMGGLGVGLGGQATGGSISVPANFFSGQAATPTAAAPAGLGMDSNTIIIAAIVLVVLLAVVIIGTKEHHHRGRR